jgi:hypothetical protein
MADKYKPPTMDWTSPGDIHKRFKLFKQKCELIFGGPLDGTEEAKKVKMLLLWIGDKGLEIYNAASWDAEGDNNLLEPVLKKLEEYTKPQSNEILARFQLRSLKQGSMSLEEFVTKARLLIDDGGYPVDIKDETLRDTLVFGLNSDKVRKDAIALGNGLTLKQVYDLAKVEESVKAHMKVLTTAGEDNSVCAVRSKKKPSTKPTQSYNQQSKQMYTPKSTPGSHPPKQHSKFKGCLRCGGKHNKTDDCPAKSARCGFCHKIGHFMKVCMKKNHKIHQIADYDDYQDQHTTPDNELQYPHNLLLESVTSIDSIQRNYKPADRIYAKVVIDKSYTMNLKVDTGADTCILTTDDIQLLPQMPEIKPCHKTLRGYGGNVIQNVGTVQLNITFRNKSIDAAFNIVEAQGCSSIIGCRQAQELGIISVNINDVSTSQKSIKQASLDEAAKQGTLNKEMILKEFSDCFDKIGRLPGDKYHIELIENPKPVVHSPRTVPIHILPLYKAELDKMIADDIITEVTEPTDWVNSIVCNITQTADGKKQSTSLPRPKRSK